MNIKWQQIAYPFALLALYWFITVEFSFVNEKSHKDSFFASPKSTPIPQIPTVALGHIVESEIGARHSANVKYSETNESILVSRESDTEQPTETQVLFSR